MYNSLDPIVGNKHVIAMHLLFITCYVLGNQVDWVVVN